MAENLELIHAGLPWNNPLKITVKADEYISLLVINRGLLNLLSNDYYLDLKTLRINQYLLLSLGPHLTDGTIHFTEDEIIDLIQKFLNGLMGSYVEGFGLSNNTAFIIPINSDNSYKNITKIQNIINQCPKNLNGKVAIFAFTPVLEETQNYYTSITDYIIGKREDPENYSNYIYQDKLIFSLMTNNITFNSFYGGTIIVLGNNYFVCDDKIKKTGKALNVKESRSLLEQIQQDIKEAEVGNTNTLTRQKNIVFQGNCKNNNCSVMSFINCQCDAFLWNIGILMYVTDISETDSSSNLPSKDTLSLFFPANSDYAKISDTTKYIIASAINSEEFSNNYITLKTRYQNISLENDDYVSLNKDCFNTDIISDSLRKILFGRYLDLNGEEQVLNYYTGGSIAFWMQGNFYSENITNIPILYSKDTNDNGFYIGLEKVVSIQDGNEDLTQYLETSYASKKKDDLESKWNFWCINIIPINKLESRLYQILIYYCDENKNINKILPSKIINTDENNNLLAYNNIIMLPSLNYGGNINLFGNSDHRINASIKNILFFNEPLTEEYIQNFADLKHLADSYNLSYTLDDITFKNNMKGALYVYNTTSMNILGCQFSKIVKN